MTTQTFSRRPFKEARRDIRDCVAIPVQSWMAFSRPHRTTEAYRLLLEVPMDLASAGFDVSVKQDDQGWHIEVRKDLMDGVTLHLAGDARSYASCLFQLAHDADRALDDLQRTARRAWERAQETEAA